MDVHFDCTKCGKCCHDLRLTLSVAEAIAWAERGHRVELLCEALPWGEEAAPDDAVRRYERDRSFPALSGEIPLRIAVTLVASYVGPCPHLQPDMRCGNYDDRPRICRIYPLDARPFLDFTTERRQCPPEAWLPDRPLLLQGDRIVSAEAQAIVDEHRATALSDVPAKAMACRALGITLAAFANEGYVINTPEPALLIAALEEAQRTPAADMTPRQWTVVTNRTTTFSLLRDASCDTRMIGSGPDYVGSFAPDG